MARLRLRPPLTGFGLSMIGPLLLQEGSEALKREHLPKIVRGEIRWCQGYSEPGAGSDLASLQTKAVRGLAMTRPGRDRGATGSGLYRITSTRPDRRTLPPGLPGRCR